MVLWNIHHNMNIFFMQLKPLTDEENNIGYRVIMVPVKGGGGGVC